MSRSKRTAIFREPTPQEAELARLKDELRVGRATLAERERALSELRGHLFSFEGRYIRQVGKLYKQLDEWEEKIAELHAKHRAGEPYGFDQEEEVEETLHSRASPLLLDLKALFRELAKRIHPDFATDEIDEQRRTRLMAQANDAFRRADHHALQRMLNGFDAPTAASGALALEAEVESMRLQLELVAQDIQAADAEAEELKHSELAKLEAQAMEAALKGRDLLGEMAARVKGRIGMAMRQYDLDLYRMKNPPKGMSVESLLSAETSISPPLG